MEKENFRVLLDFSDLQDREHNFVWMLISTLDLKNIADLKNAIINKLDLDTNGIKLFVNGGLLLEEEKIIILRENDTVQIKYDKLSHSFCHNSSLTEDRRLSSSAGKNDENKFSKHSKKHKRSTETNVEVDGKYQNLSHHESFLDQFPLVQENTLNQLKVNLNGMEVDDQTLALNADKCNGNKTLKHSKNHKSKSKDREIALQYETLPDVYSSRSSVEVENKKLSIGTGNWIPFGNDAVEHSKKRRNRNEESNLFVEEENKDMNLSKKKRKRDLAPVDTCGENKTEMVNKMQKLLLPENNTSSSQKNQSSCASTTKEAHVSLREKETKEMIIKMQKLLYPEDNTSSSKKNKSSCASTAKEVNVLNDSDNTEEVIEVPDVSEKPKDTIHLKIKEDSKPTDASVDSSALGSNCKKRKRNRKRNRKTGANLLGPFMSENINTFQNVTEDEDDSKALNPCDGYAGIRKHVRFTSPDRESTAKVIDNVEHETNQSSSQSEGSPTKAILPPTPKGPTLHENIAHATELARKNTSKFCTSPNSNCISASTKTPSLTAGRLETTKEFSPRPPLNSTKEATAEQILLDYISSSIGENPIENSAASYEEYPLIKATPPMGSHIAFKLLELDESYSPVVSDYKEGVIKSQNPQSEELEIELVNVEIKPGRTGKFENLKEDEEPPQEVIEKVTVPWPSLIEPRLISQNSTK